MKKVIVTGATSFIGVHLVKEWLKNDCDIFAVARPQSKNLNRLPKADRVHILECDMADYDMLAQKIGLADYFYHLSWEGARLPYRDDEMIQRKNYECALKAMNAARDMDCSFFWVQVHKLSMDLRMA